MDHTVFVTAYTIWIFVFIHHNGSENNAILGHITDEADVRQSIPTERGIHKTDQWGMGPGECQAIRTWSRTQYVTDCAAELSWNCRLYLLLLTDISSSHSFIVNSLLISHVGCHVLCTCCSLWINCMHSASNTCDTNVR